MSYFGLTGNTVIYDTETTGLNSYGSYKRYGFYPSRPFAFPLSDLKGNTAYIRWEVDPKTREVIPEKKSKRELSEMFSDPNIVKVGHNLLFDIRMTRKSGIKFDWSKIHDTMFMAHVLTGGSFPSYALKPLAEKILDIDSKDQDELIESVQEARKKAKDKGWCIATKEYFGDKPYKADYWLGNRKLCQKYAQMDVERTLLFYLIFKKSFKEKENESLYRIYKKEITLSRELYRMERRGVRVFKKHLNTTLKEYYATYGKKWLKVARQYVDKDFNFNSPKQLVQKLCVEKGLVTKNKTPSGQPQLNAEELLRLSKKDPLAKAILEYKASISMDSKFIKNYNKYMVYENGCWVLHPNFHQMGTNSGRLSCSNPNLQQTAKEDAHTRKADIGLKPREALGPRKGHMWFLPDFDQMEVWVFAFQARYEFMMNLLLKDKDFHTMTAEQVWESKPDWEKSKKRYRQQGKTLMFLNIYGGGVKAVMEKLDCSRAEAQQVIETYDEKLPGVREFIKKITLQVEREGYIINPFGRKAILSSDKAYVGVNRLIQGTCADLVKNAMINLPKMFRKKWKEAYLILTVHDELIIECPLKYDGSELPKDIIKCMQKDSFKVGIPIPIPISMKKTYTRWSKAKEVYV